MGPVPWWQQMWWLQRAQTAPPPQSNVIIPQMGAAPYFYVDPRAQGVPSPRTELLRQADENRQRAFAFQQEKLLDEQHARMLHSLRGYTEQEHDDPSQERNLTPQQTIINQQMAQSPGLLATPSMDLDTAGEFQFTTVEMDGKIHLLPMKEGWDMEDTVGRFNETGEHGGVFQDEKAAQFFWQNWGN